MDDRKSGCNFGGKVGFKKLEGELGLKGGERAGCKRRTDEKASVAWCWKSIVWVVEHWRDGVLIVSN